jgi:hypothetical protein
MNKLGARVSERLNRSLFFFLAVLVHLFVFLAVLGYVIFPAPPAPDPGGFTDTQPAPLPPPVTTKVTTDTAASSSVPTIKSDVPSPILASDSVNPGVSFNKGDLTGNLDELRAGHEPKLPAPPILSHDPGPKVNLTEYKQMRKSWGDDGHQRFPIYLAKYADGDWDCNHYFHDGQLTSGALPNLFSKIAEWSHNEMKSAVIKVIALDSPELINHPPPFLFFTGHKDFHLTPAEIANLHTYLMDGGAIWGDSAFAGDGSRFDVAFHREMKYVLPDKDLQFEPLPIDHDIFTTKSKFPIEDLPKGMNYRGDPIECINIDGKIAVIYTPNDYSDMMTLLLEPGSNVREARMDPQNHWTADHPLFTPGNFTWHAASYYRNYAASSAMTSYKLSMNILVYLVNRYNDELLLTP